MRCKPINRKEGGISVTICTDLSDDLHRSQLSRSGSVRVGYQLAEYGWDFVWDYHIFRLSSVPDSILIDTLRGLRSFKNAKLKKSQQIKKGERKVKTKKWP